MLEAVEYARSPFPFLTQAPSCLRRSTHYFAISSLHFLERAVPFLKMCHPTTQHTLFLLVHNIQNSECSSEGVSSFHLTRASSPQFSRHQRFCWPEQTRISRWTDYQALMWVWSSRDLATMHILILQVWGGLESMQYAVQGDTHGPSSWATLGLARR